MSGMDPTAVPGFNALSNADRQAVEQEMQWLQMRDSMNTYNNMVNRCFATCVRSFKEKKINGEEMDCTKRCVQKFVGYSQRVALRFAEHNAEQAKILHENESRGNTAEVYRQRGGES
ncbi:Mitochondrial import inner membrane translocase subunit Tim9 [Perkinsus olseni]|uniref:Mitochondrial import inner membrane translocase subunit n=1 Tax=Perkinsus olseni TaxID=32597 RepID=A0A7J6REU4_PEROL|nr:Mitochondrial import inner membrane translocase subunit Tim9 [Perkinsus olseni]